MGIDYANIRKGETDMKKYWKTIAAIVLVVAIAATVALSTMDFRLRATDNDDSIGSGEVVEQQIELTEPVEEDIPHETQAPEMAEPQTQQVEVYNTYDETQVAVAEAETTVAQASEQDITEAEKTSASDITAETTAASEIKETAEATEEEATSEAVTAAATTTAETTTEEQTTAAPNRSVRLKTNLDDGTIPYEGMKVVLTVELTGFEDCQYTIKWQRSTDNENWEDIPDATEEEYRFTLTEETNGYYWNAQVTVG